MLKYLIAGLLTSPFGAIQKDTVEEKPPFSLRLDQESYLTDTKGVLNPGAIISLKVGTNIIIYLTDGTVLKGLVKESQMLDSKIFKVYGDIINKPNTGFGFVLTENGTFAGAVVFRDSNATYTVQYSEAFKGAVLFLNNTPDKKIF